ncbi:MAG: hypothetical protein ABI700_14365 [Chloroflexota bacterium]
MHPSSDFELAQKRLKARQRKQFLLTLWLIVVCAMIGANVIFGDQGECWTTLTMGAGLMAITKLIQLYYESVRRPLGDELIAREMEWLFEADWRNTTGAEEYTFAQDRIRKRRLDRWMYGFSFLIIVPLALVCISALITFQGYGQSGAEGVIIIGLLIMSFLAIRQGRRVFASEGMLATRERKVGDALRRELQRMHPPEKRKNEEKRKREVEYTVGDDGELVEVDAPAKHKLKRDGL